jgi:hypothetical protein
MRHLAASMVVKYPDRRDGSGHELVNIDIVWKIDPPVWRLRTMPETIPPWEQFGEELDPLAALECGLYAEALSRFATSHFLNYRMKVRMDSDVKISGFGVALWLIGDVFGAATVWSRVCDDALKGRIYYSSTGCYQGGLLLWFASVWLKDDECQAGATKLFRKLLARKRLPMSGRIHAFIARFLLGEIDFAEVQNSFSESLVMRTSEEREALFYAGVRAYQDENVAETLRFWNQINDPEPVTRWLENYLLNYERRKLNSPA